MTAGFAGALRPEWLELAATPTSATHGAYLSGLLAGLGLAFWAQIPAIETRGRILGLLTAIVVLGGLARLYAASRLGAWTPSVTLPLLMELGVTPALYAWQRRVAKARL